MFEERNRKILRVYQLMIICIWKSIGEILCVEFVWYFSSVKYDYVFFILNWRVMYVHRLIQFEREKTKAYRHLP